MNEPHAAIQLDGRHHVFYQHNPAEADWANIGWGHAVSDDLVHWEHLGIALDPASVPVAPDGVWSGSSVLDSDGQPYLYFTAGNLARSPNQAVARARALDAGLTEFDITGLLVEQPTSVVGWAQPPIRGEFRDPFVWREGGEWFMLVGSGLEGQGGAALLFTSTDGLDWTQEKPLFVGDRGAWPMTGHMWELPVLLPLGGSEHGPARHVLFVAPWWPGESEHHLQYIWHWIGTWNAAERSFTPDHPEPRHFDHGGHMTGPSGTVLDDGRSILWTIAQDGRSRDEHLEFDWAHNAGLPLQLGLGSDGQLVVGPVSELRSLRAEAFIHLELPDAETAMAAVAALEGLQVEVELVVELGHEPLTLHVRRSPDGDERTELGVDPARGEVWVDRTFSSLDPRHRASRRAGPFSANRPATTIRVIVDGSMVEAYIDSVASITTRAYPVRCDATGFALKLPPAARVLRIDAHRLDPGLPPVGLPSPSPISSLKDRNASA